MIYHINKIFSKLKIKKEKQYMKNSNLGVVRILAVSLCYFFTLHVYHRLNKNPQCCGKLAAKILDAANILTFE